MNQPSALNGAKPWVPTTYATLQNTASGTNAMIQWSTIRMRSNERFIAAITCPRRRSSNFPRGQRQRHGDEDHADHVVFDEGRDQAAGNVFQQLRQRVARNGRHLARRQARVPAGANGRWPPSSR